MAAEYDYDQEREKMAALREKNQRLLDEKKALLLKLQAGEKLKANLKETRKDTKKLASQREKLRAVLGERNDCEEEIVSQTQPPEKSASVSRLGNESEVNGELEVARLSDGKTAQPQVPREAQDLRAEYQALRATNEILIQEKRKLEEHNASLIEELAALNMKYEGQRKCAEQLEAENQRLSLIISQQEDLQVANVSSQQEDVALLKEQAMIYKEDFNTERSEREKLHGEKLVLQEKLDKANITIDALQNQLREKQTQLTIQAGQAQAEPLYPRGPGRMPYSASPYMAWPMTHPHDSERRYGRGYEVDPYGYENRQSSAGRYHANASGNDVIRRGVYTGRPRVFLSPDMTAVVDDEVTDRSAQAPKSI